MMKFLLILNKLNFIGNLLLLSVLFTSFILSLVVEAQSDAMDCIFNPTNPSCVDFILEDYKVEPMLDDLCTHKPNVLGCSVRKLCKFEESINNTKTCQPFALLSEICAQDASSMSGCRTFVQLCRPESIVRQCAMYQDSLPGFTTTSDVLDRIHTLCEKRKSGFIVNNYHSDDSSHNDVCHQCLDNISLCDPFLTFVSLCKVRNNKQNDGFWRNKYPASSSSSSESFSSSSHSFFASSLLHYWKQNSSPVQANDDLCYPWYTFCQQVAPTSVNLCGFKQPEFRPWLHWDNQDHVLFKSLSMLNWSGWGLGWTIPFLIGFAFEFHKFLHGWLQRALDAQYHHQIVLGLSSHSLRTTTNNRNVSSLDNGENQPLLSSAQFIHNHTDDLEAVNVPSLESPTNNYHPHDNHQQGEAAEPELVQEDIIQFPQQLNTTTTGSSSFPKVSNFLKRLKLFIKYRFLLGTSTIIGTITLILLILMVATFNLKLIVCCLLGIFSSHLLFGA